MIKILREKLENEKVYPDLKIDPPKTIWEVWLQAPVTVPLFIFTKTIMEEEDEG